MLPRGPTAIMHFLMGMSHYGSRPMTSNTTLLHLTTAIAGAEKRIAELRRRAAHGGAGREIAESEFALELMKMQLGRLERHCLAAAALIRGTLH
jgi:hypothetical protein